MKIVADKLPKFLSGFLRLFVRKDKARVIHRV